MEVLVLTDGTDIVGTFDSISAIREYYTEEDSYEPSRYSLTDAEYIMDLALEDIYVNHSELICASKISSLEISML